MEFETNLRLPVSNERSALPSGPRLLRNLKHSLAFQMYAAGELWLFVEMPGGTLHREHAEIIGGNFLKSLRLSLQSVSGRMNLPTIN